MLIAGIGCYLLAALALVAFAGKYGFGARPNAYHCAALTAANVPLGSEVRALLRGLYWSLAAAWGAVGGLIAFLTLGPIAAGDMIAAFVATIAGVSVGMVSGLATFLFEAETGIRTPWRLAAALSLLPILGFLLILFS